MGSVWHSKWWQMLLLSPKSPGTGRDGKVRKNSSELVTNWASDKQVRRGRSARQREQPEGWLRVELWGPIWALQLTGPHSLPAPDCDQERHSGPGCLLPWLPQWESPEQDAGRSGQGTEGWSRGQGWEWAVV